MKRFATAFIFVCIFVVSASAAVTAHIQLGLALETSLVVGGGLLLLLLILQIQSARVGDRSHLIGDVETLMAHVDKVTDDLAHLERRIGGLDAAISRRVRDDLEPVIAEVEVVGALMKQVVETVADLDVRFTEHAAHPIADDHASTDEARRVSGRSLSERSGYGRQEPSMTAFNVAAHMARASSDTPTASTRESLKSRAPSKNSTGRGGDTALVPRRLAHLGEAGFIDVLRRAKEAGRIDIYLQPIVTLPQRKVRYYEALTRLRTDDGETLQPGEFIPMAERSGLMGGIDGQILLRAIQILRRLSSRSKDIGIFCNVSHVSLSDGAFMAELYGLFEGHKALADGLILEFSQSAVRAMGPIEFEGLRTLRDLGFRFSIDNVTDLRPSFQLLAERGFRFAKVASDRILTRMDELATEIHPADLSSFFARFGTELVVDRIETESQVVDILDYGIRYGQGHVFSLPRPVRNEVLQVVPEPKVETRPMAAIARPTTLVDPRVSQDTRRNPAGRAISGRT